MSKKSKLITGMSYLFHMTVKLSHTNSKNGSFMSLAVFSL